MQRPLFVASVMVSLLAAASVAQAQTPSRRALAERMTFEIATNDPDAPAERQVRWVSAQGGIVRDTPKDFDAFLKANDITGLTVYFNSPGGSIAGGLALGERLRKESIKVSIGRSVAVGPVDMQGSSGKPPMRRHHLSPNAGQCNSSCAYAFLGGTTRTIPANAHYGVHMFWPSEKVEGLNQQTYGPKDIENAQRTAARIATYIAKMDVDVRLFEIASATPHKGQMRRLSQREITELRVASVQHAPPVLAQEGHWGLNISRNGAQLVTGGPLPGPERAGASYQLELGCNAASGFHNVRLEFSLARPLPDNKPIALKRVVMVSGTKDAVVAVSDKDIIARPATFNRLSARGAGGWVAKAGTVMSDVIENAVQRPADGLSLRIDDGDDAPFTLKVALGNLAEPYRLWTAECAALRASSRAGD